MIASSVVSDVCRCMCGDVMGGFVVVGGAWRGCDEIVAGM